MWVIQRWVKDNWCLQQGSNLVGGRLTNRSSHTNELCYVSLGVSCSSSRRSIHTFSCPNKGVLQRRLTSPPASQVFSSWLFWWSLNMQFSSHSTLIQQLRLGEQWTHVKFRMPPRHDCGHFTTHHGSCPQGVSSGRLTGTLGDPFLTGPPTPKLLIQQVRLGAWGCSFLTSSWGMLMLPIQGPHFENQRVRAHTQWPRLKSRG